MKYKKTTLNNGLRILTVPMKNTQTATVVVMVGVGSRYETDKEAGLSHFLEHMFFKGTEKRPSFHDISGELDAIGGEFNAFTAKDKTGFYAKVDAKHFNVALDVISDIFLNSKFETQEIEKEKGTIVQEINMYEDTPRAQIGDIFENLLYQKSSLGREVIGSKKTVQSFRRDDFLKYKNRHYIGADTLICVAGNFSEQKIIQDIKKIFSVVTKGKKPGFAKVEEKQKQSRIAVKFKETDQTHFILGSRAYHQDHKDRFALGLLSIILGGNTSSRLFIEIREKRGLAYGIHTGINAYHDCGYLATQTGVDHGKLEETLKLILEEYKKIASQKVTPKELQKAKDYTRGTSIMNFESSDEVAMFHIDQEISRKKIMTMPEIFACIDKVTQADILRVAKDIFRNDKLNLAIIGPHKNLKKIKNILTLNY
jgi:predicted Zn-dependent peptidase